MLGPRVHTQHAIAGLNYRGAFRRSVARGDSCERSHLQGFLAWAAGVGWAAQAAAVRIHRMGLIAGSVRCIPTRDEFKEFIYVERTALVRKVQ